MTQWDTRPLFTGARMEVSSVGCAGSSWAVCFVLQCGPVSPVDHPLFLGSSVLSPFKLCFRNSQNPQALPPWMRIKWRRGPKQNQSSPIGPVSARGVSWELRVPHPSCAIGEVTEKYPLLRKDASLVVLSLCPHPRHEIYSLNLEGPSNSRGHFWNEITPRRSNLFGCCWRWVANFLRVRHSRKMKVIGLKDYFHSFFPVAGKTSWSTKCFLVFFNVLLAGTFARMICGRKWDGRVKVTSANSQLKEVLPIALPFKCHVTKWTIRATLRGVSALIDMIWVFLQEEMSGVDFFRGLPALTLYWRALGQEA